MIRRSLHPDDKRANPLLAVAAALALSTAATVIAEPATAQDRITCDGRAATIIGTSGDDVIHGTTGRDVIVGLGGNDTIYGLAGADRICGGEGRDRIFGGKGQDRIFGGDNADRLFGNTGRDVLDGGTGNDLLIGGAEADLLDGNRGRRDRLRGGDDDDLCLDSQTQTRRSGCEGPGNTADLGPLGFRTTSADGRVELVGRVVGQMNSPWTGPNLFLPDEERVCHNVFVELTPTRIDGDVTAEVVDDELFQFLAFIGDGYMTSGILSCDTTEITAKGWWFDAARMTVGSTEHLVLSFPIPISNTMRAFQVRTAPDTYTLFDPPTLNEIPTPTPNAHVRLDRRVPGGARFSQENADGSVVSVGTITTIGRTDRADSNIENRPGECVIVSGTITVTVDAGAAFGALDDPPRIGFLVNGEEHTFNRGCWLRNGTLWNNEVSISHVLQRAEQNGIEQNFYATALIPFGTVTDIDAVIVKGTGDNQPNIYNVARLEPRDELRN